MQYALEPYFDDLNILLLGYNTPCPSNEHPENDMSCTVGYKRHLR